MIVLAESECPDQIARMRRLIKAFAVRVCLKTHFRIARPTWWMGIFSWRRNRKGLPWKEQPCYYFGYFKQKRRCFREDRKCAYHMTRSLRKRTFGHMRLLKILIRLRIRAVWSESSLGTVLTAKDAKFLHADNENSDLTARRRRLIWVFVGRTYQKVCFPRLRQYHLANPCSLQITVAVNSLFYNMRWFSKRRMKALQYKWCFKSPMWSP